MSMEIILFLCLRYSFQGEEKMSFGKTVDFVKHYYIKKFGSDHSLIRSKFKCAICKKRSLKMIQLNDKPVHYM